MVMTEPGTEFSFIMIRDHKESLIEEGDLEGASGRGLGSVP